MAGSNGVEEIEELNTMLRSHLIALQIINMKVQQAIESMKGNADVADT